MDQALPEYERRNRKLRDMVERLRKENEAVSTSNPKLHRNLAEARDTCLTAAHPR
jgi:hypothetical protein